MGEYSNGILGTFRGLVGTVVGSTYRTKNIMKSRPKKSTKEPKQSQIDQRSKFALVVGFYNRIKQFIDLAYKSSSVFLSPMNAAVQDNLPAAITGVSPNFTLDYSKLKISNGSLDPVTILTFAAVTGSKVNVTWSTQQTDLDEDPALVIERGNHTVRLLIYAELTGATYMAGYSTKRSAGAFVTRVPNADAGEKVHVWLFFMDEGLTKSSKSQYLGNVTMIE